VIRSWTRAAGGWALLVLGVAALFVPLVPGTAIMAAGMALLGRDHFLVRPVVGWAGRLRDRWRGVPAGRP